MSDLLRVVGEVEGVFVFISKMRRFCKILEVFFVKGRKRNGAGSQK